MIRELRKAAGLTQKAFCELFGVPFRTLQDWEYGKNKEPEYFVKLVKYYMIHEGLISEEETTEE